MKRVVALVLVGAFASIVRGVDGGVVRAQDAPPPTQEKEKKEAPPAQGQDGLPKPPAGWWEKVQPGAFVTYDMTQLGTELTMTIRVDDRQGSSITFSTTVAGPDFPAGLPAQQQTIDAADPAQQDRLQPVDGSTVKKVGEETITAAGREWACGVYEIEREEQGGKVKMTLWHSPELAPVFSGGTVKCDAEIQQGGPGGPMRVTMLLREVGTAPAPAGEGAPAPAGKQGE